MPSLSKSKRPRIPRQFYAGVHMVVVRTVGELKRVLSELPDDLPTSINGQGLGHVQMKPSEHLRISRIS